MELREFLDAQIVEAAANYPCLHDWGYFRNVCNDIMYIQCKTCNFKLTREQYKLWEDL